MYKYTFIKLLIKRPTRRKHTFTLPFACPLLVPWWSMSSTMVRNHQQKWGCMVDLWWARCVRFHWIRVFLNGHAYRICFESVFSPTVICSHAYPQPHSQKFPNRCSSVFAVNCLFSEIILYIDYVLFFPFSSRLLLFFAGSPPFVISYNITSHLHVWSSIIQEFVPLSCWSISHFSLAEQNKFPAFPRSNCCSCQAQKAIEANGLMVRCSVRKFGHR